MAQDASGLELNVGVVTVDTKIARRGFLVSLTVGGVTPLVANGQSQRSAEPAVDSALVKALAAFTGQELDDEQLDAAKQAISAQLANLSQVRAYDVKQIIEPALKFHVKA
jgi:hypothetical protein